jgi:hypothetical protein
MDDLGSQDGVKVCHIFHLVCFVKVKFILNMNSLIVKAVHFFLFKVRTLNNNSILYKIMLLILM